MEVKLQIVLQSHLSDLSTEVDIPSLKDQVQSRIHFLKYLTNKFRNAPVQEVEIDPDYEYSLYLKTR